MIVVLIRTGMGLRGEARRATSLEGRHMGSVQEQIREHGTTHGVHPKRHGSGKLYPAACLIPGWWSTSNA